MMNDFVTIRLDIIEESGHIQTTCLWLIRLKLHIF
jgi:hypothetical protein